MAFTTEHRFPRVLAEGLWVLGNYYFNLYLVKGEQASALIEVGVSGVVNHVVRQLDDLGIDPSFLVVMHPHSDHVTGLDGLRERFPQALVVTGEGAESFLSHPRAAQALVEEDSHMGAFLSAAGLNSGRPPVEKPPALLGALIARDGHELDLGGLTLSFLSANGHAHGSIAVHVPELGALMSSDSLGFRFPGRGVFPLFFTGYREYMDTLRRLSGLRPYILGPAHQGPVEGFAEVDDALREALDTATELKDRIVSDGRDGEEIAEELFRLFYKDELTMYSPENIKACARLLVKRAVETMHPKA